MADFHVPVSRGLLSYTLGIVNEERLMLACGQELVYINGRWIHDDPNVKGLTPANICQVGIILLGCMRLEAPPNPVINFRDPDVANHLAGDYSQVR